MQTRSRSQNADLIARDARLNVMSDPIQAIIMKPIMKVKLAVEQMARAARASNIIITRTLSLLSSAPWKDLR